MELVVEKIIDSIGRIQLPSEVRRRMFGDRDGAGLGEPVRLDVNDKGVLTMTPVNTVPICGECGRPVH